MGWPKAFVAAGSHSIRMLDAEVLVCTDCGNLHMEDGGGPTTSIRVPSATGTSATWNWTIWSVCKPCSGQACVPSGREAARERGNAGMQACCAVAVRSLLPVQ